MGRSCRVGSSAIPERGEEVKVWTSSNTLVSSELDLSCVNAAYVLVLVTPGVGPSRWTWGVSDDFCVGWRGVGSLCLNVAMGLEIVSIRDFRERGFFRFASMYSQWVRKNRLHRR